MADELTTGEALPPALAADPVLEGEAASPPYSGYVTFRSLRHRNYRLYFFGQMVSLIGSWMQMTALMWLAFDLTHQSKWPAAIFAGQILPTFLLGAWSGTLADRWPKRRLIMTTQSVMLVLALLLALVVAMGQPSPWVLLAITVCTGLVQAVDLPARLAFVIDLVGRDDVMNAVALNSVLFNVARVVGPVIGVALLYWLSPAVCFLCNGLSYVAVLWALRAMNLNARQEAPPGHHKERALTAGFVHLWAHPSLLFLMLAAGITALCGWPFMSLLPAFAEHQLQLPKVGYGAMLSSTGIGALTAGLTVATFGTLARRRQFLGSGVAILSLALIGLSLAESLSAACACCALAGLGLILFFSTGQAVLQLSAEDGNRGQLMGIWAMVLSGGVPFGNLVIGPAADRFGEPTVLCWQGVVCGTAALLLVLIRLAWKKAWP